MDYSKITDNDEVIRLLIHRRRIEKQIQEIDSEALIKYELEKLAEPQANGSKTSTNSVVCSNWMPSKETSATRCSNCGHDRWQHEL